MWINSLVLCILKENILISELINRFSTMSCGREERDAIMTLISTWTRISFPQLGFGWRFSLFFRLRCAAFATHSARNSYTFIGKHLMDLTHSLPTSHWLAATGQQSGQRIRFRFFVWIDTPLPSEMCAWMSWKYAMLLSSSEDKSRCSLAHVK